MKLVDFCMSCYFVGVALMLFSSFNGGLNNAAGVMNVEGNMMASGTTIRNLLEKKHHSSFHGNSHQGDVNLEDYRPFDPSPSSKAVKPKPIQHGTPLMPYIPTPTPSPPMPSNNDAFP